jgi:hypothetical protein
MYAFVDLEAVVWRKESDCIVDVFVVQDVVWDSVQGSGSAAGLGDYGTCYYMTACVSSKGTSHLVLRLSPRCSRWDLRTARRSSQLSSAQQIFSWAAWGLQSAPRSLPHPLPAQDWWLRGLLPSRGWRVWRVAGLKWDGTFGSQNVRRAEPDLGL